MVSVWNMGDEDRERWSGWKTRDEEREGSAQVFWCLDVGGEPGVDQKVRFVWGGGGGVGRKKRWGWDLNEWVNLVNDMD